MSKDICVENWRFVGLRFERGCTDEWGKLGGGFIFALYLEY